METNRLVHWLDICIKLLRYTGLWPGKTFKISYVLYTAAAAGNLIILYNILFTLHILKHEILKLELVLNDGILYFSTITVVAKCFTLLYFNDKIHEMIEILDDPYFKPDLEKQPGFYKNKAIFKRCYMMYFIVCLISASISMFGPLIDHFVNSAQLGPPTAIYNLIPLEAMETYLYLIYFYQTCVIYTHLCANIGADGLLSGFLLLVIMEVRMLKERLSSFKRPEDMTEQDAVDQFKHYFRHYQTIERFMDLMNKIFSTVLFVQFTMTSVIICVILLGFLIPGSTNYNSSSLGLFLIAMVVQILAPCWLGTTLIYESEQLAHAAYCSSWLAEGKVFKRNLIVFIERTQIPITISACKVFPVSLDTFTRIMKTAYSFYTVLQKMQLK